MNIVKNPRIRPASLAWRILLVVAVFLVTVAAAKTVKVVKEAKGREGPGSYYKLVAVIPAGTGLEVIEEKENWYKIRYDKKDMWISGNTVTQAKKPGEDAGSLPVAGLPTVTAEASPAVLTAAIKGFWTRFSRNAGDTYELPVDGCDISVTGYESFANVRARETGRTDLMRKYRLKNKYKDHDIPYSREMSVGYACASAVADAPPILAGSAIEYLHHVGWYIASATERYDIRFNYYILDTDRINAVACPGGYIVFTRGLLELLKDESELAALLAHEMAHVIAGHGMLEAVENKERIKADSAFEALGREVGTSDIEADLIGITNRAMSIARSPKLDTYEYEADELALLYMVRCGYDPGGLTRLLDTMHSVHARNVDIFDLNYRNHPDFGERVKRIRSEMRNYRNYKGGRFEDDYKRNMIF